MSGYVASARVRGIPHLVRAERTFDPSTTFGLPNEIRVDEVEVERERDGDRTLDRFVSGLADRVGAFRERWSQLTFYLFDPNSWR